MGGRCQTNCQSRYILTGREGWLWTVVRIFRRNQTVGPCQKSYKISRIKSATVYLIAHTVKGEISDFFKFYSLCSFRSLQPIHSNLEPPVEGCRVVQLYSNLHCPVPRDGKPSFPGATYHRLIRDFKEPEETGGAKQEIQLLLNPDQTFYTAFFINYMLQ